MSWLYIPLTIGLFFGVKNILAPLKHPLANPLLWCIVILIGVFSVSSLDFQPYLDATAPLVWLLEPAVVALAIPLFAQAQHIKHQFVPILMCCSLGVVLAMASGTALAMLLTHDQQILLSLLPKSVTSAVAMEISQQLGGIAPLSVAVVIVVGIIGAFIGVTLFKIAGITHPQAQGLALGCATHAAGTALSLELGETQGAFSSIALVLCAIITAIIAPLFGWLIIYLTY